MYRIEDPQAVDPVVSIHATADKAFVTLIKLRTKNPRNLVIRGPSGDVIPDREIAVLAAEEKLAALRATYGTALG